MAVHFGRVAIIGIGLIGSSIARRLRRDQLAGAIVTCDADPIARAKAVSLGLVDEAFAEPEAAVAGADLVMICVPIGAYPTVADAMRPAIKPGAIISDVGSVKRKAIDSLKDRVPAQAHLVPGHPVAGTENSGPEAGFPTLFDGRWCLLTPLPDCAPEAIDRVAALWTACGSNVEVMDPDHHDRIMAIVSHLPHLIAYSIVGTAVNLEDDLRRQVIKYSASGFRDFTRIAASDPTMWRDIFLNNREAVLDIIQRFQEDLAVLQRAIRWGEGDTLFELFTKTRAIRRGVIDAKQA